MEEQLNATGVPYERVSALPVTSWQQALSTYGPQIMRRGIDVYVARFRNCTDAEGGWNESDTEACRWIPPNAHQQWLDKFTRCQSSWDPDDAFSNETCPYSLRPDFLQDVFPHAPGPPLDHFYNLTKLDKDVLSKQTDDMWTTNSSRNLLSLMLSHEHALDRIHEEFKDRDDLGPDDLALILEDDATVPADIQRRLEHVLPMVPKDFSSLRIGYYGHTRDSDGVGTCVLEPSAPFGAFNFDPGAPFLPTDARVHGALGHVPFRWYYSGAHAYATSARGPRLDKFREHVRSLPITHHWIEAIMATAPDGYRQYLLKYPLSDQSRSTECRKGGIHNHKFGLRPVDTAEGHVDMFSAQARYCRGDPPQFSALGVALAAVSVLVLSFGLGQRLGCGACDGSRKPTQVSTNRDYTGFLLEGTTIRQSPV